MKFSATRSPCRIELARPVSFEDLGAAGHAGAVLHAGVHTQLGVDLPEHGARHVDAAHDQRLARASRLGRARRARRTPRW